MDTISNLDLVIFGMAAFVAAFLTAISGGGGGFITTPLLILEYTPGLAPWAPLAEGRLRGTLGSSQI